MTLPRLCAALALSLLALSACGKKPDFPAAPQGADADRFPRHYPDPALDPQPGARAAPPAAPVEAGGPSGTPRPEGVPKPVEPTPQSTPQIPAGTQSQGTPGQGTP